ncbi:MAG: NUDIX domain-containing protein, partial [Betaproteobacteria bacterium]|nr:NUDIX domain-containing protein [Betaproteobacteria bacterium]
AGLLLVRDKTILMQHRAPWVHNGDTWGIPGGARDSHESVIEAAIREAHEEVGINGEDLTTGEVFVDGTKIHLNSSKDALAAGIGYVPPDRLTDSSRQPLQPALRPPQTPS